MSNRRGKRQSTVWRSLVSGQRRRPAPAPRLEARPNDSSAARTRLAELRFAARIGGAQRRVRLSVRTWPSQGRKTGSIPVRAATSSPIQVRPKPFLDVINADAFSRRIVVRLVVPDLPNAEIFRIGMGKIEAADAGARMHRKRLGKRDAGLLFRVEQIEQRALLGVIGRRGITGGRADATILFAEQF